MSDLVTASLWKIASSVLNVVAKHGIQRLLEEPPVSRAITTTATSFTQIEGLEQALSTWCGSEEFASLLEGLKAGKRDLTAQEVVDSFISTSGFYVGDETLPLAHQILTTFARRLEEEIYASQHGLTVHAYREEVLHEETRETTRRSEQSIIAQLATPLQEILRRLPLAPDDTGKAPESRERILHARIDEAKVLLREGKARTARSILERLRREIADGSPSPELQFRLATNLGACFLELGEYQQAKEEFEAAYRYQPDNQKALSNVALAALLDGNYEQALELSVRARQQEERDPHAISQYIQALDKLGRTGEMEEFLRAQPWIVEDPICAFVLGSIKYDDGKYSEAEEFLRVALRGEPENPLSHIMLAQAIVSSVQETFRDDPPLPWRIEGRDLERIEEAEALLTRSLQILEGNENRRWVHLALINRAAVRGLLGRLDEALKDCERVLVEDETHPTALRNKGLTLFQMDKTVDAIECFERVRSPDERAAIELSLAYAYIQTDQADKAIGILEALWKPTPGDRRQIRVGDILALAHAKLGSEPAVGEILHKLNEIWPGDPDALSVVARHRHSLGEVQQAIECFHEALAYARGHQRDRIALDLADAYYAQGKYAEAAEIYERVVDKGTDNPLLRKYLIALFYSGSYREALLLAQNVRGGGDPIPIISEVEALVLEYIGDLEGAKELRLGLSRAEPKNITHGVRVALLEIRRGDWTTARERLSQIRVEDIRDNPRALMTVAQARALLGMKGALPLAYRARRLDFGNPDMHLGYLGLFLKREEPDRGLLEPCEVGIDSTVHLKRNGETRIFTVLDEDTVNRERGELGLSDPLAVRLMGRRKGDCVVLKEGPFEELTYEIADIQSKYVCAFQETLSCFTTWFPDNPALFRVEIREGDLSKIQTLLDARHRRVTQAMDLYRKRHLTLGAFACLVGSSLPDVWGGMIRRKDGVLLASTGNPEDAQREAGLLSQTDTVVLELTAILTLGYLDLLDRLPRRFANLYVPQPVLDELSETIATRYLGPKPAMTVWKEGNRYVREEVTPEALEQGRKFLERVKSFIESETSIVPSPAPLALGKRRFEELEGLLTGGAIASIVVAEERRIPLYSDDLGLRLVGKNDWGVEGVWTQAVLVDLRDSGILSNDEYCQAVKNLALGNYHFLSVNSQDLMWVVKQTDWSVTDEVGRLFERLHGPDCNEDSAVSVLADVLRKAWLEAPLYHQKLLILDLCLVTLTSGRSGSRTIRKLKAALRPRLALIPLAADTVFRSIDLWERQNLLRRGLLE